MTKIRQDGWIKHDGGECPVPAGTEVNLWLRNGEVAWTRTPEMCAWMQDGDPLDVVGYRVVEGPAARRQPASEPNVQVILAGTPEMKRIREGLLRSAEGVLCPACGGNNRDAPCAYPGANEQQPGCLRATEKTDGASEKDRALTALCDTIESTGGLVRGDSGLLAPAGDEDWIDLGEAYVLACRALGREPMIDAEEN